MLDQSDTVEKQWLIVKTFQQKENLCFKLKPQAFH